MSPGRKNRKMSVAMRARRRGKKEDQEMPSTSVDAEVMDAGEGAAVTTKNAKKNGTSIAKVNGGSSSSAEATFQSLREGELDDEEMIDTVQVVTVRFQIKMEVGFGEVVRICGSHESMGEWDVANALLLNWSEGNVWTSEEIELPVDGIYIYKYCVAPASNPNMPSSWQSGNNQVLSLSPEDGPILYVKDSWSGNPNESAVFSAEGVKQSKDERLVDRVRKQDETVKRQTGEIKMLRMELKTSKMQVKALREEARLSANVRIALKDQLNAEKKRNMVFEEQVGAWKKRFMQITGSRDGDKKKKKSSEQESR